jgi:mycobactin lysine-N-oxygenase
VKKIAVIGGGPKAAALCAKAHILNDPAKKIEIRVYERAEWGAAWTGDHGYTDGVQRLCTPAERDVGFPYGKGLLNAEGAQNLFEAFSWSAFLVDQGSNPQTFGNWVDRGRKSPPHRLYARYLGWVIERSDASKTIGQVTGIVQGKSGKWTITYLQNGREAPHTGFDGVVFTGAGPAKAGFQRIDDPRIIDGVAFWQNPEGFLKLADDSEEPVIIAGAGGTSAAIAASIAQRRPGKAVLIIGNQAALFTRTESFFENALFSDDEAWAALKPEDRIGVTERLTRGVVWSAVSEVLSASADVKFRPGRVESAFIRPAVEDAPAELRVAVKDATGERTDAARLIIDAAGFDAWWFTELLPPDLKAKTDGADEGKTRALRKELAKNIGHDLSLDLGVPGLHAPMLAQAQGPGFASLMTLGLTSDRILETYAAAEAEPDIEAG